MKCISNIGKLYTCQDNIARAGMIEDAAIVWQGEDIVWAGRKDDMPDSLEIEIMFDAHGMTVLPGLIDCHTHFVFAGSREDEFVQRVKGDSYLEIAKRGGGIASTVKAMREEAEGKLYLHGLQTLDKYLSQGVTTVEGKSGYGLNLDTELATLQTYKSLNDDHAVDVVSTMLSAHVIPPESKDNPEEYLDLIKKLILPMVVKENLAEFFDVFIEDGAFSLEQARELFLLAQEKGLKLKAHAEQLSNMHGAQMAAELGAVSADHLEFIDEAGLSAMKDNSTVAVALPLASLYTQSDAFDARKAISAGVRVALATDFNPGSAPVSDLHLAMMLGCNLNRLTPEQALQAVTINAAYALDRSDSIGSIEKGKKADFSLLDIESIEHWMYRFSSKTCKMVFKNGHLVFGEELKKDEITADHYYI